MMKLVMYVVIRGDISPAAALVAAGHAGLGTYLTWQTDPVMERWQKTSFVKKFKMAKDKKEFDLIKKWGEHRVFTESTMDNLEVSLGFRVVFQPNPLLKELPNWSPSPCTPCPYCIQRSSQ